MTDTLPGGKSRRGEFQLIADLFAPLAKGAPGALGLKDDAALVNVSPGCELVVTTDTIIAGVHFLRTDPPETLARKALRVNLSDLAAKGAKPIGFLHAFALHEAIDDAFLGHYAAGLALDVAEFNVPLLGGDTTASHGPLTITITALGEVEKGKATLRSGAKPGDILYVTGTIGDGALGLACQNPSLTLPAALTDILIDRYRLPRPRLSVGQGLAGLATACLDISDGLCADAGHLCDASGVAAIIAREAVPLSPAGRAAVALDAQWWSAVLGGGDDYELAFTVAAENTAKVDALAAQTGIALTAIGRISEGSGVTVLADGIPMTLAHPGYSHR